MENSWDLIHMRMLDGSITSWSDIYQKIYRLGISSSFLHNTKTSAATCGLDMDGSSTSK